jgi:hypothetical protein
MAESSFSKNNNILQTKNQSAIIEPSKIKIDYHANLLSLISDIKDIFCHLSEEMIQVRLNY